MFKELTEDNLMEELNDNETVVVQYAASWFEHGL
jgi:hypothetical protein